MMSGTLLHPLRLTLALVGLWLGGWLVSIAPAYADLRVCNQSSDPVSIALGYRAADTGWKSEGWWVAPPTKCAVVYQGDLNTRYYYLYVADDIGGGAWDGSFFLCTSDQSFTILGVKDCLARGYERTGFFEVDTQNRHDWMLELTDNNAATDANAGDATAADGDTTDQAPGPDDSAVDDGGGDAGGDTGTDPGTDAGAAGDTGGDTGGTD